MGEITIQIQPRNFEIIRDRIGEILVLELADQVYTQNTSVWRERTIGYDKTELPSVNIGFDNSSYDNDNPIAKRGANQFYIDVHCNSKDQAVEISGTKRGDTIAAITCNRISGIIDYILSAPEYYNLGFDPGVIASNWVSSIKTGRLSEKDSLHTIVNRITFNVISNECVGELSGVPFSSITTKVTINETDKGHRFELIAQTEDVVETLVDDTVLTDNTILV